jgi:hypothetical protein
MGMAPMMAGQGRGRLDPAIGCVFQRMSGMFEPSRIENNVTKVMLSKIQRDS